MPNIPFKNTTKNIPVKDESKSPYVRLTASIRMLIYLAKSPSPYFVFEDSTFYINNPDFKSYRIFDNINDMNFIDEVTKSIADKNLNDVISSDDFSSINVDNVISFTTYLENGRRASLKPPFDDFNNQLENAEIGTPQNYQFVVTSIEFQNKKDEEMFSSFLSLIEKASENLINSSLFLDYIDNDLSDSFFYLKEEFDNLNDSFLLLVYHFNSTISSDVNPDIAFDNVAISTNGDTLTNPNDNDFVGEYGTALIVDFDVINLFRSPLSQNIVQLQKHGSWITIDSENIQPISDYWFGSVTVNLQRLFEAGDFVYGDTNNFRLIAVDEQGNEAIYDFSLYLDYPLNVEIETSALVGEPDSEALPTSTVTDADGEVIEATYDYKNFIYIKTDRQTLSNINVEYSLDSVAWSNAEYSIVTVGGWDYAKVLIPEFGTSFSLRIEDETMSALTRALTCYSTWINTSVMTEDSYNYDSARILDLEIDKSADTYIYLDGATISETT